MKLHILTVGEPKLPYAKAGWHEYMQRLKHYHSVRVTHLADKYAANANYIRNAWGTAYAVALVIDGPQLSSPELAAFLEKRSLTGQEVCFIIGGPEGLPADVIARSHMKIGLSRLTFPHDLAMVILSETLYRASTIAAGQPYHK